MRYTIGFRVTGNDLTLPEGEYQIEGLFDDGHILVDHLETRARYCLSIGEILHQTNDGTVEFGWRECHLVNGEMRLGPGVHKATK